MEPSTKSRRRSPHKGAASRPNDREGTTRYSLPEKVAIVDTSARIAVAVFLALVAFCELLLAVGN